MIHVKQIALTFVACFLLAPNLTAGQTGVPVAGTWEGVLKTASLDLRLVFRIQEKSDGLLSATLDSPDQGAFGIRATEVSFKDGALRVVFASIGGIFDGTWRSEKNEVKGVWQQAGREWPLVLRPAQKPRSEPDARTAGEKVSSADQQRIVGFWQGTLKGPGFELRIVFKIKAKNDRLSATLDSPDQGARDIPVSEVSFKQNRVRLEARGIGGVYEGTLQEDGRSIRGTWRQAGQSFPLTLTRTDAPAEVKRPQEPKRPFPYEEEEVAFENREANIRLAGTLTLPASGGPFPAVVLISGSGPQNRDEEILGHKPFLVLADHLTRKGIAVLRFDDRGVGKSGGDFKSATTEDFASDVLAAVQFLKTRSEIDARQIGLVGHSEGGLIAPMVAARSRDVAFIVLLAGPALPGERILLLQKALIMKAEGASDSLVALDRRMSEEIFSIIKREPDEVAAREKILAYDQEAWEAVPEELKQEAEKYGDHRSGLMRGLQMSLTPWFRFFLTYDPGPTLQKVTCPVLALYGEKDLQVPAGENRPALAAALKAGGNREVTIEILPGLNHLFQTAETGAPGEYGKIEETFSPVALRAISDWIQARRKPVNR